MKEEKKEEEKEKKKKSRRRRRRRRRRTRRSLAFSSFSSSSSCFSFFSSSSSSFFSFFLFLLLFSSSPLLGAKLANYVFVELNGLIMSFLGKLRQGEYERGEEKLTVVVIKEEKHLQKGRAMPLGSYSAEMIFCNVSVSMMTLNY